MVLTTAVSQAEIPEGYYDPAGGLTGQALQWALHSIIDGHDPCSYNYIWTAFYTTDNRNGNKVWDMYSDIPGGTPPYLYTLGDDQGGSASAEGQGYNREHSWPKSWFGNGSPMNTDLFHIVPSDIYVNSRRGNHPYAEVSNPDWISMNGSRVGPSSTPGYSGTAFEPVDGYKGDFARSYFYMATRYKGQDSGWPGSAMTNGADLLPWAVDMLLEWHANDPVSDKEIERNEAVYAIQDNRNPFIDHPEYAVMIYDPESGVHSQEAEEAIQLFCSQNPFMDSVTITASAGSSVVTVSVMDVTGRVLSSYGGTGPEVSFVWASTEPGLYLVVTESGPRSAVMPVVSLGSAR